MSHKLIVAKLFGGSFLKALRILSHTHTHTHTHTMLKHTDAHTPSPALGFNSSHGHLVNYPSTSARHQWPPYSPEQREDLNEIINIRSMAPTCAPGHSDPSQDLLNQAGRAGEGQGAGGCWGRGGCTLLRWPRKCLDKAGGASDCLKRAPDGSAVVNRKTGAIDELGWAKLSQAAGRHHGKYVCVLWTKQVRRAMIQEGEREMEEAMK